MVVLDREASLMGIKRPCVLIVEDNPVLARVAEIHLKRYEIEVHKADNGEKAVVAILSQDYDLVLMDIHMPVIDGLEAVRTVRRFEEKRHRHTLIVGLTASESREHCLAAGMDGYASKPAQYDRLIETWLPQLRP
jgi:CheY-like chemotaxis protein